jgi:ribosomal protein L6P/L9E
MPVEMQIKKLNTKKRRGTYLNIRMWFAGKKQACSVSTLKSLIRNMITGVTEVR